MTLPGPLRAELGLIRSVNNGLGAASPIAEQFQADKSLGPDQRAALVLVLSSSDRITGFRGLAGSGKTTTLQELRRAVEGAGLAPLFCAPTAAATEVLRKDGFAEASTLAKLLNISSLPSRSVVVLDEAGFVGTGDMAKLFDLARKSDSRVVLVGDTGQHAAVARGDALRVIEEHSGYRFGTLTQIRRQRSEDFKAIVSLAAKRQTKEAFQKLQRAGDVVEVEDSAKLYQKAAAAYLSATERGKVALLVSPTWAEIEAVTDEVRSQLRERGTLAAKEETVRVFDPLGWTDAQKQLVTHYEPGQQLRFVKATKYFEAGETVQVVGHKGTQLLVRRVSGNKLEPGTTTLSLRSPSSFDVGEAREINVAAGDALLLRANAPGFVNGERVQVKAIHRQAITLEDGRTLPEDYRTFTHGYAVTSHAAQGKTVDEVMVVASSRSFAAVSQESFYVGISRARERARIYTDDAELLGYRVQDAHTRKAAVELEGLREALHKAGFTRTQSVTPRLAVEEKQARGERIGRTLRAGRMVSARLVQQWAQNFRQWLGERLGLEQTQSLAMRQTVSERMVMRPDSPRQSRGISM